jgi:hypothetical protein
MVSIHIGEITFLLSESPQLSVECNIHGEHIQVAQCQWNQHSCYLNCVPLLHNACYRFLLPVKSLHQRLFTWHRI